MRKLLILTLFWLINSPVWAQLSPLSIGDIPAGKTVVVKYDVTINNPISTTQVSNQGMISGTNFSSTSTNTTTTVVTSPDLTATILIDNLNFSAASVGTPATLLSASPKSRT